MNYELAKQLKDAGFPNSENWIEANVHEKGICMVEGGSSEFSFVPTLSELIEACGDKFHDLCKGLNGRWTCVSFTAVHSKGDTPEEAVANLWLALNIK
jgi:hypothetical protein